MAFHEEFTASQIQTLFFLWSYAVINCLEIVLYMTRIIEMSDSKLCSMNFFNLVAIIALGNFWNKFGVTFYIAWSILGVIASGSGIYGIEKNHPEILIRNFQYFLGSAALKTIFTVILFISLADTQNSKFRTVISYASSGPLLLTLIDRFTNNFPPLPIALAHIIIIVFLVCMAFLVRYIRNVMSKQTTMMVLETDIDEIPMR